MHVNANYFTNTAIVCVLNIWSKFVQLLSPPNHSFQYPSFEKMHELKGHSDEIYDIDVHPEQLIAVSVSCDREGVVWDLKAGKEMERFDCQSTKGTQYWTRCCKLVEMGVYCVLINYRVGTKRP